jgi:hypothetical protein
VRCSSPAPRRLGPGRRSRYPLLVLTHRNLIATTEQFLRFEASQYTQWQCLPGGTAHVPRLRPVSLFAMGLLSLDSTYIGGHEEVQRGRRH